MFAATVPRALSLPYRLFAQLLVVANIFAATLTVFVWWQGRRGDRAPGARGGYPLTAKARDLFYGVELNPTVLGVDLKLFSYRPSLIGLFLVNVSFAAAQYERLGHLTGRMLLYQLFCLVYVLNYFQFEYGMLYTWDVIAERFGGMLVWGDYVVVPFFYSLAGWYLVDNLAPLPIWVAVALTGLYAFGFWLFRGANEQKHRVKVDPDARIWGRPAKLLEGRLLVSGFWGIGRKLNYTGELLLYLSWILLCGFESPVPYVLPLWLAILFAHRAWRDDRRCRVKYGLLWTTYCHRARFRMVPFLY